MAGRGLEHSETNGDDVDYAVLRGRKGTRAKVVVMEGTSVEGHVDADATVLFLRQITTDLEGGRIPHRAKTRESDSNPQGSSIKSLRRRGSW